MRSSGALLLVVQLCFFGMLLSSAEAQIEPSKTASAKATPKVDPRYAVAAGAWSDAAISLFNTWGALDDNPGRHVFFYSPDHKELIEVEGENVFLRVGGRTFKTEISNDTKHDAELSWSPDSTKYFITWTESGELGPWHMQVYGVDDSGVHELPKVEDPARKDFEQRIRHMPIDPELDTPQSRSIWKSDEYCEPYHVIGGRWLNGSKEILLSVLVRNTSACRYMGEFNVYRVNAVTGEILQRYTAEDAHKQFGSKYLPLKAP
jgi:hypothetical protein